LEAWGTIAVLDVSASSLVERDCGFVATLVIEEFSFGGTDEVDTGSCDWPLLDVILFCNHGFSGWESDAFKICLCSKPNQMKRRRAGRREIAPAPFAPDLTPVRVFLDDFSNIISSDGFFG
jgi:hypothetical protein